MKTHLAVARRMTLVIASVLLAQHNSRAVDNQIVGWNNLGMHCMDSDYSVFSVLPPYNTIEAQLIVAGRLVTNGAGYTVTYQAIADANGSFNSTATGKGNFYDYVAALYGPTLLPEKGLAGWAMPGVSNNPQSMLFEVTNQPAAGVLTPVNWFRAEGIPISPYDDAHNKNPYPVMRLIARNAVNQPIATNDIVLPVSDEMDCRACHASGSEPAAEPAGGWVWDGLPERDFRLNILRLHDEREFSLHPGLYASALFARGFRPQGLFRSVTADGKPVLCAICHASEALGLGSFSNTPPLTVSMHAFHGHVQDPQLGVTLDSSANRAACYRCHPGAATRCLRGAMGAAIGADGSPAIQCQDCHGDMSLVGSTNRVGWFMEPNCQSCHTGTADHNNGQIRYTSVFTDTNGTVRAAVDQKFATQPDTPAPGISLYRFSAGHGGLQCEACHGSTHAEFPSTHANDNRRNVALQGHVGMMVECAACHTAMPDTANGGPHGMHGIGQGWVGGDSIVKHSDWIGSLPGGITACVPCHGTDYRGTVLSRAQANRTLTASFDAGTMVVELFRGAQVGCFNCHNGPGNDNINTNAAPSVGNVSTNTSNDQSVAMTLPAMGTGLALRIISQSTNGSVGLSDNVATYVPNPGYVGTDTFTFAAYDGLKNSPLGTGTVTVTQGPSSVQAVAHVPASYPAVWPTPFAVVPTAINTASPVSFEWDFDDGSPTSTNQFAVHSYQSPGVYLWTVKVSAGGNSAVEAGLIEIGDPVALKAVRMENSLTVSWPDTVADALLETTAALHATAKWIWVTNNPIAGPNGLTVTVPIGEAGFFRVRRPW